MLPIALLFLLGNWMKYLNERNPLGNKGDFAKAYAKLTKDYWNSTISPISAKEFKRVIGRHNETFSGFN